MIALLILLYVFSANGWTIPTGAWVAAWTLTIVLATARVLSIIMDAKK